MKPERSANIPTLTSELRLINWICLPLYGVIAFFLFWDAARADQRPFYAPTFQVYYGTVVMPALLLAWFGFLIGDIIRRFRWQWLAASLVTGLLAIAAYFVIAAVTVLPG